MALTDESMVMPVTPFGGSGGGFGGDFGAWIVLFLIFGMFGAGGWGGGGYGGNYDFPWLLSGQNGINANTNAGFQNAAIQSSLGDIQTGLCGGFAGVTAAVNGSQAAISQQLYTNQIAELERSFAAQTANTQGISGIQSQLAQCCCDNRLATCQTQNIVQAEGAETRLAIQNQTQAILDKMCQQELDAYKRENDNLRAMVNMQNLAASQSAQTAALIADNTAQTQYIVNRVAPYPIPSYTVPNPFGTAVAG
jgi:hypothetical protein